MHAPPRAQIVSEDVFEQVDVNEATQQQRMNAKAEHHIPILVPSGGVERERPVPELLIDQKRVDFRRALYHVTAGEEQEWIVATSPVSVSLPAPRFRAPKPCCSTKWSSLRRHGVRRIR